MVLVHAKEFNTMCYNYTLRILYNFKLLNFSTHLFKENDSLN